MSQGAAAQTIMGHVPASTVAAARADFQSSYKQGGMSGLTTSLDNCYMQSLTNQRQQIRCIREDMAAANLDYGFRQMMIGRGINDPGPTTPFFSDQAFSTRMRIYVMPILGSVQVAQSYFGKSVIRVEMPDQAK